VDKALQVLVESGALKILLHRWPWYVNSSHERSVAQVTVVVDVVRKVRVAVICVVEEVIGFFAGHAKRTSVE
jgi:hypothetical protein